MKIYLSGETTATVALAANATKELKAVGHTVYNPALKGSLQADLHQLFGSDAIVLLPSAWANAQARAERAVAEAIGAKKIQVLDLYNPADRKTLKLKPASA